MTDMRKKCKVNSPAPEKTGQEPAPLSQLRRRGAAVATGTVYWLLLVLLGFLGVNSFLFTSYFQMDYQEVVFYRWDFLPLNLLWLGLFLGLFWLLFRRDGWQKVPLPFLRGLLLAYVAVAGVVWVFLVGGQPTFDSAFIVADAHALSQYDFYPLGPSAYSARHPYQLGMVLYLEGLIRLFGPRPLVLIQLLNVGFAVLSVHWLVTITQLVTGSRRAVFASVVLLFGCLHPVLYTSFIYGQLPGLAFSLLGIRLVLGYLRGGKKGMLACAVPAFGVACIFKTNYLIFAVAAALVLAVEFVRQLKSAPLVAALAVLVAAVFAMQPVYGLYQMRSGQPVGDSIPMNAYLAMGLQESPMAPGWFNDYHEAIYRETNLNPDATRAIAAKEVENRVKIFAENPGYAADFFYHKAVSQWNEPTFEGLWVNHYAEEIRHLKPLSPLGRSVFMGKIYHLLNAFMDGYHLVVLAGAAAFLVLRRKKLDMASLLPGLAVLGGFLFHLFWEGKSQYIWPYFVLLVPYCAGGVDALAEGWFSRTWGRRKGA